MALVEVVRPITASDDTIAGRPGRSPRRAGSTPVEVKDQAGFIVNALLFPYLNNAVRLLEQRVADQGRHRHGHEGRLRLPHGALRPARPGGPGHQLAILDALYDEFRDPNYAAVPLLRRMVRRPSSSAGSRARASTTTAER